MYLSEARRRQLRQCIAVSQLNSEGKPLKQKPEQTPERNNAGKACQILFDARDGREVFTPF